MRDDISIRPEGPADYADIISLILGSFSRGTDYSDGTDVLALVEEIRGSAYHIPELSFVALLEGKIVGHFMFSRFPLSPAPGGGHGGPDSARLAMLAPVSVHPDFFRRGIGTAMLTRGLELVKTRGVERYGFRGIIVDGNYLYYNRFGFCTSSKYGVYPTCGWPVTEDSRYMMCMETRPGSMEGCGGYVVYDMYHNA